MAISKTLNVGSHVLPTESGSAKLGDSTHKWVIDASQISGSVSSATSATTASKIGTDTVGDESTPVYIKAGVPTVCTSSSSSNVVVISSTEPTNSDCAIWIEA